MFRNAGSHHQLLRMSVVSLFGLSPDSCLNETCLTTTEGAAPLTRR